MARKDKVCKKVVKRIAISQKSKKQGATFSEKQKYSFLEAEFLIGLWKRKIYYGNTKKYADWTLEAKNEIFLQMAFHIRTALLLDDDPDPLIPLLGGDVVCATGATKYSKFKKQQYDNRCRTYREINHEIS